jgi:hypothetical protein
MQDVVSTKDGDERLADCLLERALGVTIQPHDDGSRPSMYDRTIIFADGRRAAVEVVSTRDPQKVAQAMAAHRRVYTRDTRLSLTWKVRLEPAVRLDSAISAPGRSVLSSLMAGIQSRQAVIAVRIGSMIATPMEKKLRTPLSRKLWMWARKPLVAAAESDRMRMSLA